MLLRRIAVENVRSFLDRAELRLDGKISILVGPNGGGKTNLLDITVIVLRRYLFSSVYPVHSPSAEQPERYQFQYNDALNFMTLDRHFFGKERPQFIEVELEVTERDCENMRAMKRDAVELDKKAAGIYVNINLLMASEWELEKFAAGKRLTYRWDGENMKPDGELAKQFLQYMTTFEVDFFLRERFGLAPLSTPMLYLPVNRSANSLTSHVELPSYNAEDRKRQSDATFSRSANHIVALAVGKLAQKYRRLLEEDKGGAKARLKEDGNLKELTTILMSLGYEWDLETVNPDKNIYNVRLSKQGSSFLVSEASSGERELFTYLFAIFVLNVHDALIVVDEPELHLHPKWQRTLYRLFVKLAETTGNQFLLATHSPTFISPESIEYVSRVFALEQRSRILRLASDRLPEGRHLLQIVNSQNNEAIFFADRVVLVEGLSDRVFFDAILKRFGIDDRKATVEVISVGGKGLFQAYAKLLSACQVNHSIIADRDYIEQIGGTTLKALFTLDEREIKNDVIENPKSLDGKTLVEAIDGAIATGAWSGAQEVWDYIKGQRRKLKPSLSGQEAQELKQFIEEKRTEGLFVLEQGSLEDYLPAGFKDKDIGKLIRFLSDDDFWSQLPSGGRPELEMIAGALIPNG